VASNQPTNAQVVAAVQGLDIDGVRRHYDEPPASIDTADLPVAFPLLPTAEQGEPITSCMNDSKTRSIGFVIAFQAVGQGAQPENYDQIAALMDNFETAVDALETANFIDYEITSTTTQTVSGNEYWSLVCNLTFRAA